MQESIQVADVAAGQSALARARQISDAAVACGFEWETLDDVWTQAEEEVGELKEAYAAACAAADSDAANPADAQAAVELELGDVLFSLVNVGRKMGVDAEASLHATCEKFSRRWAAMEKAASEQGSNLADLTTAQLNEFWRAAKQGE